MGFAARLLALFHDNGRDLPWRRTRDPWAIWVSEIMLQQTRVEAVRDSYQRFLARFPRPADLAASEPHRRVGALDGADRDALLAYLRQLDGNSLSAPTGNSVFRNGFESP